MTCHWEAEENAMTGVVTLSIKGHEGSCVPGSGGAQRGGHKRG
jgi:hypothetical protein